MKKFRLLLLAAFLLGTFLNSCSPDDNKGPDPDPDPDTEQNYPYKLNVVYFVPSDQQANTGYEARLSEIFLEYQKFVGTWMEHWGYGKRSFGLPLKDDGTVEVVLVNGAQPISGYPNGGGATVGTKMQNEVRAAYTAQGITPKSDHYMVVMAVNNPSYTNVPVSGSGQWAFAPDYPNMSQDNIAATMGYSGNAIGDMFHELLHALNTHHVGPSYSQYNDPKFGTAIMGVGNWYYGRRATFIHEASAATILASQVGQITAGGTWYDWDTLQGSISDAVVGIDGGKCTVSGSFIANRTAKHVVVRFYNAKESSPLVGGEGYDCFGAVAPVTAGNKYSVTFDIADLRYTGYQSGTGVGTVNKFKMVATVLYNDGLSQSRESGVVYTLVNKGGTYTLEASAVNISRENWVVTTSHALPEPTGTNGDTSNTPKNLVDGDQNSCLTVVKPGATYKGITVPASDVAYVQIDMGRNETFNTATLDYSMYKPQAAKVSFYKSDNGTDFTLIKQAVLDHAGTSTQNVVNLGATVTCRHLRMTYDEWDTASGDEGGAMMFRELVLESK